MQSLKKLGAGMLTIAICAILADYIILNIHRTQRFREPFVYVPDRNTRCSKDAWPRKEVDVVMFVPTPIQWGDRRRPVLKQFLSEKWTDKQVVLIFVLGTKTGERLEFDLDTSSVEQLPGAKYLFTECRDYGDERNNPNGTSSTTCKVYEACVHIAQNYKTKYVWRGADDSYVNLKMFFRIMSTLPSERLYMGIPRETQTLKHDLLLELQPRLKELFGLNQFGFYMGGAAYVLSGDVAEFIGTFEIPPHQTWCEDVMVGMWLNPFRITKLEMTNLPGHVNSPPLFVHYMKREWWYAIKQDGSLYVPYELQDHDVQIYLDTSK